MQLDEFSRLNDGVELWVIFQAVEINDIGIDWGDLGDRSADLSSSTFQKRYCGDGILELSQAQNQRLRIGRGGDDIGNRKILEALL